MSDEIIEPIIEKTYNYLKIRVMNDCKYFDCYQKIDEGNVIDYIDNKGNHVELPQPHEAYVLNKQYINKPE